MISKSAYHDEKGNLVREFATTKKKQECYNEIKTKGKCSEEKKKATLWKLNNFVTFKTWEINNISAHDG